MITGEWTDEEPEEVEEHNANDSKENQIIAEEEEPIAEASVEKLNNKKDQVDDDDEVNDETIEKVKKELADGANLASPLKQELMEFLGMDNIDESISEEKVSESGTKIDNQKEEDAIVEQVTEDVEQTSESVEEISTAEEVEDELAQLRKEMEHNKKEEHEEEAEEEKQVQEAENKEISNLDLQEQLETDVKIESTVTEPLVEDKESTEVKPEEIKKSEEDKEQSQSKDALKSIITDWADEGQDDDL